jgi:hypothetical protein
MFILFFHFLPGKSWFLLNYSLCYSYIFILNTLSFFLFVNKVQAALYLYWVFTWIFLSNIRSIATNLNWSVSSLESKVVWTLEWIQCLKKFGTIISSSINRNFIKFALQVYIFFVNLHHLFIYLEVTAIIVVFKAIKSHHLILFVKWILDYCCIIRSLSQTWQIHTSETFISHSHIQMPFFHLWDFLLHIFKML